MDSCTSVLDESDYLHANVKHLCKPFAECFIITDLWEEKSGSFSGSISQETRHGCSYTKYGFSALLEYMLKAVSDLDHTPIIIKRISSSRKKSGNMENKSK